MEDNKQNYTVLLTEIFKYYNLIHDFIKISFVEIDNTYLLDIDFNKDFVIANQQQDKFILYNDNTQKFYLSIPCGMNNYNRLINTPITRFTDIKYKFENQYYSYFSEEERVLIVKKYNISFIELIKSEFLYEYLKKVIKSFSSNKQYIYSDEYGNYSEKLGFCLKNIIIELEARLFSKKYDLFYLPNTIGNNAILRTMKWIITDNNRRNIILNDSLDKLLTEIPNWQANELITYEENEFEKRYKLKKGTLENERVADILYKSVKQRKKELIDQLKKIKKQLVSNTPNLLNNSSGYVNFMTITSGLIVIFIMLFILGVIILWR